MRRLMLQALLLSGCTGPNYESLMGRHEAALISRLGPPSAVYRQDESTKWLIYNRDTRTVIPGTPPSYTVTCSYGVCDAIPFGGSEPVTIGGKCRTSFQIIAGTIAAWRREGSC